MQTLKPWCWEPLASGSGPDWLFLAEVAPSSAAALARAVSAHAPPGFTACPPARAHCPTHQRDCLFHSFIDAANAEAYLANLAGVAPRNIWVYDLVQLHGTLLQIECGYGGRGPELQAAETAFLRHVLAAPGVALRSWEVLAGGDGYEFRSLRAGSDLAGLTAYLSRSTPAA